MDGSIQLLIELAPDGKLNVSGPLANKVLCMGLLEMAKQNVLAYVEEPSAIIGATVVPPKGLLDKLRGR